METTSIKLMGAINSIDSLIRSCPTDTNALLRKVGEIGIQTVPAQSVFCIDIDINGTKVNSNFQFELCGKDIHEITYLKSNSRLDLSQFKDDFYANLFCTSAFQVASVTQYRQLLPSSLNIFEDVIQFSVRFSAERYALFLLNNVKQHIDDAALDTLSMLSSATTALVHSGVGAVQLHTQAEPHALVKQFDLRILKSALTGVIVVSANNQIRFANETAADMFGYSLDELLGLDVADVIPNFETCIKHALSKTTLHCNTQISVLGMKAKHTPFNFRLSLFPQAIGAEPVSVMFVEDATQQSAFKFNSNFNEQRFKTLTTLAPVGILHVDPHWNNQFLNDKLLELTGFQAAELEGKKWISVFHPDDINELLWALDAVSTKHADLNIEIRIRSPLGVVKWVKICGRPVFGSQTELSGFLMTIADITSNQETQQKLKQLAEYDSLTEVYNRGYFQSRLAQAIDGIARRGNIALLYIDLDDFKKINDTLGHEAGDQLLIGFAARLKSLVRAEDTVSRLGGDEFTLVIEQIDDIHKVTRLAELILDKMRTPFLIDSNEVVMGISVGIALCDCNTVSPETLTKQADAALYKAKTFGKNRYQFYTSELDRESKLKLQVSNKLLKALANNEFSLTYQPVMTGDNKHVASFESLLRWKPPGSGVLLPSYFVPILEEIGLMQKVGLWVIEQACSSLKGWINTGLVPEGTTISVNVSACQLRDGKFAGQVCDILNAHKLPPHSLILELAESYFVEDYRYYRMTLTELTERAVNIALDNFGTGRTSISCLLELPISRVKVSKKLVNLIAIDLKNRMMVESIVQLSKNLGLKVTAEGVDTQDKLAAVKDVGFDFIQGEICCPAIHENDVPTQIYIRQNKKANIVRFDSYQ